MDPIINPFAPGAGTKPPELAGRDELRETIRVAIERVRRGLPTKSILMVGLRGVGKTVLRDRMREDAETAGIQTLRIEAPEDRSLPALLAPQLRLGLIRLSRNEKAKDLAQRALRGLAGFAKALKLKFQDIEVGFDLDPEPGLADNGDLEHDLQALIETVGAAVGRQDGRGREGFAVQTGGGEGDGRVAGAGLDAVEEFDHMQRPHFRAAQRIKLHSLRRLANHGDGFDLLGIERQDGGRIFKEDNAVFRRGERELLVRGRIGQGRIPLDWAVEQTDADDGAQNAVDGIIHRRLRDAAVGERGLEMGDAHVVARGHFQVIAKLHGVGLMHAAPVGHHLAVKAPVRFQDVLEQP